MEKYFDSTLSAEERAIALTDAMTVEEQASQLRYDAPAVKGWAFLHTTGGTRDFTVWRVRA